jgi:hypothetical protein
VRPADDHPRPGVDVEASRAHTTAAPTMSWLRRPVTVPAGLLLGEQLFVLAMIAVRLRNLLQWLALLVLVATFIVELVDVARARHRRHRGV